MWRGCSRYFSTYTAPLPNAASASFWASPKSWENLSGSSTIRIPLPPPPAVALMITGNPMRCAASSACVDVLDRPRRAGHRRHAGLLRQAPRRGLVAHLADLVAAGADEGDVGGLADIGELGVLGEEAVAGVDRVGTGDLGGGDQIRDLEVGGAAGRRPDAYVIVGEAHVQRFAVGLAVDRHRGDPELPARANHPQGDLPAVGDQHLLEHQGVRSSAPEDTDCPEISVNLRSEAESTPETRSANSLGLVE